MTTSPTRLGDICELINGGAWKQTEYVDDGISVVQVSNMKNGTIDVSDLKFLPPTSYDRYKKHTLKECDLVIATVGSHATQASAAGRATIVKGFVVGMLLNQNAVAIRSKSESLDQEYLGLIGRSDKFQFYLGTVGQGAANQVRIALSAIKEYKCDLPPIGVQRRIAEVISAYDGLIENNRRRIQLLEQAALLLYREWFVHLRFPGHEHVSITNGVPEGWEREKVISHLEFVRGVEPGSKNYMTALDEGRVPFLRVGDFGSRYSNIYIDSIFAKGKLLEPEDVAITMDGTPGLVSFGMKGAFSSGIRKIVPKEQCGIGWSFIYELLQSDSIQSTVDRFAKGTTILHASSSLNQMVFLKPIETLLGLFEDVTSPVLRQILLLSEQNKQLTQARDLLLPRLMNGEVTP